MLNAAYHQNLHRSSFYVQRFVLCTLHFALLSLLLKLVRLFQRVQPLLHVGQQGKDL